jgi:carotenoid cleavage dioxygenase-like enzyme
MIDLKTPPYWEQGNLAPVREEAVADDLLVLGDLPCELSGTLYRNGPNPQFPPRGHHHWFAGDGMVHAFHIEEGRVSYRNRWMRTPKFELERSQGRALFGAFGNPAETDPSAIGKDSGVANTNVVSHAGKLLALEESHLPFAFDPLTLNSLGYHDFGGALPRTIEGRFTAHPKIDPATGEMIGYSYSGSGLFDTRMSLIVIGADGALQRRAFFDAPYCAFVHDFLLTDRHVVFPILPVVGSMERARTGAPPYAWEGNRPGYLGVVGRDAPIDTMRWFEVEPCYVFHVFNAWTEGNRVVCDVLRSERPDVFPDADGQMPPPNVNLPRPVRWTLDLDAMTDVVRSEVLAERQGESPRCDERLTGRAYRHAFYVSGGPASGASGPMFTGVVHLDLETGRSAEWEVPEGDSISEAVFVPSTPDATEGRGWLLAVQHVARENRSDLLVFDAEDVHRGPVARAASRHRVPAGFHGNWVSR